MEKLELKPESVETGLLSETVYTELESEEFDAYLKEKGRRTVAQKKVSPETKNEILYSDWCVPCHNVLTQNAEGGTRLFHVQPDTADLLSYEQELVLKELRSGKAIVIKGRRSYFAPRDERELKEAGLALEKVIDVDTSQWWRMFYDPTVNEIWIDVKDKKLLKKYKGF